MVAEEKPAKAEQAEVVRRDEQGQYFQPATDITETADAVILKFDMPGVAKENVDLTIDKDMLTVIGKAEPEENTDYGRWIMDLCSCCQLRAVHLC